ncbi:MAG TPA: hypothetical protein VM031_05095, partial [Phycisphaerae bacterium]|nr:hypothetical protein [Phycisphaerae bacterium]
MTVETRWITSATLAAAILISACGAAAGAEGTRPRQASVPAPGPQKGGLASLYPGDEGLERDPRVLFVEDFETGTVAEIGARWGSVHKKENLRLSDDVPAGSPGGKSLHIAKNGHLFTHTKGADTVYARFYVKFHKRIGYVHHFVHLVADSDPKPWPKGGAGIR